ncbi:MAG TPA: hypothetical protein ENK06_14580 [Gammaproteobacteria bacterium]|nr:hypothetical protein [Gammaproteobacteria bacterium]
MFSKTKNRQLTIGVLVAAFVLLLWSMQTTQQTPKTESIGNSATLSAAYEKWKTTHFQGREARVLNIPLTQFHKAFRAQTQAKGSASIDLLSGDTRVELINLKTKDVLDAWLLGKVKNDGKEKKIYLGQLTPQSDHASLNMTLKASDLSGFSMSKIVIEKPGKEAASAGLFYGSPTLFQRLYYEEIRLNSHTDITAQGRLAKSNQPALPFSLLVPAPAFAQNAAGVDLNALVAKGEDLFFNETFGGNGRTCGTCHRAENNFTIDPAFIATLPANDPLFVAEYNPDLVNLENPVLMREYGLILANIDGAEDPENKFVMRSVSHTLGLSMSIQSSATTPPMQMTGWSGDGAPGNGTLRDFSTGAVIQHFTKTLDRVAGVDFRLPSDAELDALEAFMLSLGRQSDPNLNNLHLLNPDAERGRLLFLAEDSKNRTIQAAKCNICHRNAGALTRAGENSNFITGVENMPHPADITGELRPRDGGFGAQFNGTTGGFGDNSFNTPSLWEAADTAPYFHHNGAATLEEAIAFYDSAEFKNSVEGQRLLLMDTGGQEMAIEVDALAAFLRVINVIENIRSSSDYLTRAMGQSTRNAKKLLNIAKSDVKDILRVLGEGELHENTWSDFREAKNLITSAKKASDVATRDGLIAQAMDAIQAAKLMIVDTTQQIDNEKPSVAIISPASNSTVASTTTIEVSAVDNVGIDSVVLLAGSMEIARLAAEPFSLDWDTTILPDGPVSLTAIATDGNGNSQNTTILVTIDNVTSLPAVDVVQPTISFIAPSMNEVVAGTRMVSVNALDDVAIDHVIFTVDQTDIGLVSVPPYEQAWDTSQFADGVHQITVTAVDTSNNTASASIATTVDNAPVVCTVYSCPNPPPPSTEPPPVQSMPSGSSPDGEFSGVLESKNVTLSTLTIASGNGLLTLTITADTAFMGSIANNIDNLLVGHVVQGEFFSATNEMVWIEADLPPGL